MDYRGIVNILDTDHKSIGTGFFVSTNGYFLTCYHVFGQSKLTTTNQVPFKYDNIDTIYFATIKAVDKERDIVLLHTDIPNAVHYPLRNYSGENDNFFSTFGFPRKVGFPVHEIKYEGLIDGGQRIILKNANDVMYGFSGAPLVNKNNESIGMIVSIPSETENRMSNVAFAIPADVILRTFSGYLQSREKIQTTTIKSDWAKGVIAFCTDKNAAECAARVYFSMAMEHPNSSIILPTGRSAKRVFQSMLQVATEFDDCPFGKARLISDTETFGVLSKHENSRTKHINEMLIEPLRRIKKEPTVEQLHFLSGVFTDSSDPVKNAQKAIKMFPPSIHAVSVSPAGEILGYEVNTYNDIDEIINDPPRIVEVGEYSKKYIDPNQPSKSIISIGLGTALSADVLLILVFDTHKAKILSHLFTGSMTAKIPVTLLRNHPNAFVLTTERIAREAKIDNMVISKKNAKEAAEWIIGR